MPRRSLFQDAYLRKSGQHRVSSCQFLQALPQLCREWSYQCRFFPRWAHIQWVNEVLGNSPVILSPAPNTQKVLFQNSWIRGCWSCIVVTLLPCLVLPWTTPSHRCWSLVNYGTPNSAPASAYKHCPSICSGAPNLWQFYQKQLKNTGDKVLQLKR